MPWSDQGRLGGRRCARPSAGGRRPAGKPVCGLPRGGRRPLRRARPQGQPHPLGMNPQSAGREPVGRVDSARPIRRENPPRPASCVSAPTCGRGRADQGARPEKRATAQELWLRVAFLRLPQSGPSVHVAAHSAPSPVLPARNVTGPLPRLPVAASRPSHAPERCVRVPCREAGSPCKWSVTEFTHPTGAESALLTGRALASS
jgi:hypothetical protein